MIEKLMNFNHFTYKKPFSGSDKGNRFKYIIQMVEKEIEATENDSDDSAKESEVKKVKVFKVTFWTGEKNSKETPDDEKTVKEFEFNETGYDEALNWLNEQSDKLI